MHDFLHPHNFEEIEKAFLNIGINVRKNENEFKSFPEVIDELASKWQLLSKPEDNILKEWICRILVGIRKSNVFKVIMDKLSK